MSGRRSIAGKLLLAGLGIGVGLVVREVMQRRRQVDLDGRVVLITGGSRGLGLLLAQEFAREGCRVAVCARDDRELELALDHIHGFGPDVLAFKADVADRQQAEDLIGEVTRRYGRVDVLVNNAGIIQVGPVQTMTHQDFDDALGAIFWGTLNPTLAILPQMLERKSGRIVNITSVGAKASVPHVLPYSSAKFATIGLSEGLTAELAEHNISVTTVVPGLMRTGSYLNAFFKGNQKAEYTWFSLGAALPFLSMDAERAARQIVAATRRGESEVILSIQANLLARFHGLFPGTVVNLLALANRLLLPSPDGAGTRAEVGMRLQEQMRSPAFDLLTRWGMNAAKRFHQYPGPRTVLARPRKLEKAA